MTIFVKHHSSNSNGGGGDGDALRPFQSDNTSTKYAIMGGTGMQGGAAIDYILSTGVAPSDVRTLTRNANSPAAKRLAERGVMVLEGKQDIVGDLGNHKEVEDVKASYGRLFDGADCVFGVTFTQYDSSTKEQRLGELLFEVIRASRTVKQVVFSGGERTGIRVLDAKADIETSARALLKNTGIRCVFLHTSFFMENVLIKGQHKRFRKLPDGKYELSLPLPYDRKIAMISARDIGTCAGLILSQRPFLDARPFMAVSIIGDLVSPHIFLSRMRDILPEYAFVYRQTKLEELMKLMGEDQANLVNQMYEIYYKKNSNEERTRQQIEMTRQLHPKIKNMEAWIKMYAKEILEQQHNN